MDTTAPSPAFPPSLARVVATVSIGFVVTQLDVTIVNIALAHLAGDLHLPVTGLQWVVDAYTLAFAVLMLSGGALGDRFGARRLYIAGLALFALASLAFVAVESRTATPMLPLSLFRHRTFSAAVLFGICVNLTYYGTVFVLALYLQRARGESALQAGLAFLPLTGGFLLSNLAGGGGAWQVVDGLRIATAVSVALLVIAALLATLVRPDAHRGASPARQALPAAD